MKLGDIADMPEYLSNRCYCPGEIYDMTGIFCRVYSIDDDCEILAKGKRNNVHGIFVICKNQIIYFELDDEKIKSAVRIDATENNKQQVLKFLAGEVEKMYIDEFEPGSTEFALKEMLTVSDAILMS